MARVIHPAQ